MKNIKNDHIEIIRNDIVNVMRENLALKAEVRKANDAKKNYEISVINDLFSISDSIQLKIDSLKERIKEKQLSADCEKLVNNFASINLIIDNIFTKYDIEEIDVLNKIAELGTCKIIETKFVPQLEENTIVQVIRKGYRLKEKIIRPAEVVISKK